LVGYSKIRNKTYFYCNKIKKVEDRARQKDQLSEKQFASLKILLNSQTQKDG
jgi:hypothetical protein